MVWFDESQLMTVRSKIMPWEYQSSGGGHALDHMRGASCDYSSTGSAFVDDQPVSIKQIIGQSWTCIDVVSYGVCRNLDLPAGSTYSRGVRKVRRGL